MPDRSTALRARLPLVIVAFAALASCRDGTSPSTPRSVEVVAGATTIGVAGQKLTIAPTFVVKNDRGDPLAGIPVTIRITAGDGILTDAPSKTAAGPTGVGSWSLGPRVGLNELEVTVAGLTPLLIRVTAKPGPASKIVPLTSLAVDGRAGEAAAIAPRARVIDAFENPLPLAVVSLTLTGGGTAPATVTTDSTGALIVPEWSFGTVAGQKVLTLRAGDATVSFIADVQPADPATITILSGAEQPGRAGAPLDAPILLSAADRFGNTIKNQPMTFEVTSGNGTLSATSALPSVDGVVTLTGWTLGRTALPQTVQAVVGPASTDVTVTVKTDYHIDVRFYGAEMTVQQKALFTNAAARLSAIITGDVPDMPAQPLDLYGFCGVNGLPVYTETLDDVVIYAAIQDIDGPGKILARAGPCLFRDAAHGGFAAFGVMEFDAADLESMLAKGTLQDVITHEMLHVLGIGTAWTMRGLLSGARTEASTYTGAQGRTGCLGSFGDFACGTGVPVENNGISGTADAHWRESIFQTELMTGYSNAGGMPLSAITVGALADLGYVINPLAADPYRVPQPASRSIIGETPAAWEKSWPPRVGIIP